MTLICGYAGLTNLMKQDGPNFWSFFNALGKLFGFISAIGCGVLSIWSFVSGQLDLKGKIICGGLTALFRVLGILMMIAKPT